MYSIFSEKRYEALVREDCERQVAKGFMLKEDMKNCFKSVYGSPIFTYMRNYRMNYAASLLKSDKSLKVAEIAGLVGYDSPANLRPHFIRQWGKRRWNIENQLFDWNKKGRVERKEKLKYDSIRDG